MIITLPTCNDGKEGIKMQNNDNTKKNTKMLFKNKSIPVCLWTLLWIFEVTILGWLMNKRIIPGSIINSLISVCAIFCFLLLYLWIKGELIAEKLLYTLLIAVFMFKRLYIAENYQAAFFHPISLLLIWVLLYILFRIFLFDSLISKLEGIIDGFREYQNEQAQVKLKNRENLQQQREQRLNDRKERIRIQQDATRDFWKHLFSTIKTVIGGIVGGISAVFIGIKDSKATTKEDTEKGRKGIHINRGLVLFLAYIVLILFLLSRVVFPFIIKTSNDEILWNELFTNAESLPEKATILVEILMTIVVVLICLMAFAAIILNAFLQLYSFSKTIMSDLSTSTDKEDKTITAPILFTLTVGVIVYWLVQNYPYNKDTFANAISSGQLVIYPLALVLFHVIISFLTRGITTTKIKEYMEKYEVDRLINDILELGFNAIRSVVSYLKIVTGDFLISILELADEDEIEDDLEE